jgi:hypothetical protein
MVLPARHSSVWGRSNLPPFKDVLVAKLKKSWRNTLSPDESAIADKLFDQVADLTNAGGLTMCGTEVVSVFLRRRVQPWPNLNIEQRRCTITLTNSMLISRWSGEPCFLWTKRLKLYLLCLLNSRPLKGFDYWYEKSSWPALNLPLLQC